MRSGGRSSGCRCSSGPIARACVSRPGPFVSSCRPSRRRCIVLEPFERLQRPDQHAGRDALRPRDGVQAPVDAVVEVDVGGAGRTEQRVVAGRVRPIRRGGVRRRVVRARVGLRLDDAAGRGLPPGVGQEHSAEKVARHLGGGSSVEVRRQDPVRGPPDRSTLRRGAGAHTSSGDPASWRSASRASMTACARCSGSTFVIRSGCSSITVNTSGPNASTSASAVLRPTPA